MPPNPAPHILDRLLEAGLVEANGMGAAPLSWRELAAWREQSGAPVDAWELKLIRRLSAAYVAEGRRAEGENCPPPWRAPVTQAEIDTEEARLRMVLG